MKDRFYHPELDRLRFAAFFAVFAFHFFPKEPTFYKPFGSIISKIVASCVMTGSLGVDLFFCLSSFLITTLLMREFELHGAIDVQRFWLRRILRIWPLYYAFLIFAATIVPRVLPAQSVSGHYVAGFVFFYGNWVCASDGFPPSVTSPLWSISVEEQFYLVWPLLLSIVPRGGLRSLTIICLLVAWVTRLCAVHLGLTHPAIWCNTLARLDPIAAGAMFALFAQHRKYTIPVSLRWFLVLLGIVFPITLFFLFGDSCYAGPAAVLFYPVAAICSVSILAAVYGASGRENERNGAISGCLASLGRISYGLYIFHTFAIQMYGPSLGEKGYSQLHKAGYFLAQFIAALALTIVLASASYRLIETPFLRLKERFAYVKSRPISLSKDA